MAYKAKSNDIKSFYETLTGRKYNQNQLMALACKIEGDIDPLVKLHKMISNSFKVEPAKLAKYRTTEKSCECNSFIYSDQNFGFKVCKHTISFVILPDNSLIDNMDLVLARLLATVASDHVKNVEAVVKVWDEVLEKLRLRNED